MKCQKCAQPSVVHLTEVLSEPTANPLARRTVEIHLCLTHAVEAGLIVASPEAPQCAAQSNAESGDPATTAIVPVHASGDSTSLALARDNHSRDGAMCIHCGMKWTRFKQTGLMGCAHDYQLFEAKLLPLLKRAQEGAAEHVGKVPPRPQAQESRRQVATLHLRRQLQKAIDAEQYEEAATLRDQLRHLEQN